MKSSTLTRPVEVRVISGIHLELSVDEARILGGLLSKMREDKAVDLCRNAVSSTLRHHPDPGVVNSLVWSLYDTLNSLCARADEQEGA